MRSIHAPVTVIFDFDGTIADSVEMVLSIYNRIAPEYNCRPVGGDAREILRGGRPQDFYKEYGMTPLKLPLFALRMRSEVRRCIDDIKPFEGIDAALRELRAAGYLLGIVSSNDVRNIRGFFDKNHFNGLFDFVQSGKHLFGKDAVIKRIMRKKNISVRRAVYVGDETRDIEAAKKAKIPVVAVAWGYQSREVLLSLAPDGMADHPEEIARCIRSIFGDKDGAR